MLDTPFCIALLKIAPSQAMVDCTGSMSNGANANGDVGVEELTARHDPDNALCIELVRGN